MLARHADSQIQRGPRAPAYTRVDQTSITFTHSISSKRHFLSSPLPTEGPHEKIFSRVGGLWRCTQSISCLDEVLGTCLIGVPLRSTPCACRLAHGFSSLMPLGGPSQHRHRGLPMIVPGTGLDPFADLNDTSKTGMKSTPASYLAALLRSLRRSPTLAIGAYAVMITLLYLNPLVSGISTAGSSVRMVA